MPFLKHSLFAGLLLTSWVFSTPPATRAATEFIRFVENADGSARLELADVAYRRGDVTVRFVGAVHIADLSFYESLSESFRHYDSLLYEMIKPKDAVPIRPPPGTKSIHWIGRVQQFMQTSLNLSYQMEGIDYTQENFVHADLDVETFEARQNERGESMPGLMAGAMRRSLARSMAGQHLPTIGPMDIVNALNSPERARDLKYLLGKQMAFADLSVDMLDGGDSVLINERNQAAIEVLKKRIAQGDDYIGIFYGAAHLRRMETTLIEQMGFMKVDVAWRTAWDIPRKSIAPTSRPTTRPGIN